MNKPGIMKNWTYHGSTVYTNNPKCANINYFEIFHQKENKTKFFKRNDLYPKNMSEDKYESTNLIWIMSHNYLTLCKNEKLPVDS